MYACLPVSVVMNKDYYYQLAISKTATTRTQKGHEPAVCRRLLQLL